MAPAPDRSAMDLPRLLLRFGSSVDVMLSDGDAETRLGLRFSVDVMLTEGDSKICNIGEEESSDVIAGFSSSSSDSFH